MSHVKRLFLCLLVALLPLHGFATAQMGIAMAAVAQVSPSSEADAASDAAAPCHGHVGDAAADGHTTPAQCQDCSACHTQCIAIQPTLSKQSAHAFCEPAFARAAWASAAVIGAEKPPKL